MPAVTNEKIVWVAVPWAVGVGNVKARVSVLVSPRLEGSAAISTWSLAPETAAAGALPHCSFIDWPSVLEKLKLAVFVGDPDNPAAAVKYEFPAPRADRELWGRLFGGHTPVSAFGPKGTPTTANVDVRSYSPRAVASIVREAYIDAIDGGTSSAKAMKVMVSASKDGALRDFLDFHQAQGDEIVAFEEKPLEKAGPPPANCEIRLLKPDDRGRLIVIDQSSFPFRPFCYFLPPLANAKAFVVTFRNESNTPFSVQTGDGSTIDGGSEPVVIPRRDPDDDRDVAFRATADGWRIERVRGLDFHEALSALSAYPQLMRRLGLLFDLELPLPLVDSLVQNGWISVAPVDQPQGCAIESRSVSPWTAFATRSFGSTHVFAARPQLLGVDSGLLRNDPARHHIVQLDIDGAGLQMYALANTAAANEQVQDVARGISPDAPTQPPAFRHGGYALIDEQMDTEVQRAVRRRQEHEGDLQTGAVPKLFADDLVQGYRVDASRDGGPWRSLCARRGKYAAGHDAIPIDGVSDDEGHVSLVADQAPNGELRVSRAVFRWDGWSLAVPRPMKAIDDGGNAVENTPKVPHATFPLMVDFVPVPLSLERLRFGSKYLFRARTVDVAGNALRLDEADAITDARGNEVTFRETDETYDRFEPVDAPVVAPLQQVGRGETADVLVIRQDDRGRMETKQWLILPPKTSQLLAEKHGALDPLGNSQSVWQAIVARDGEVPGGTTGAFDGDWIASHEKGAVPYFADPLARGAALHSTIPGVTPTVRMPFFATDPLQSRAFRLLLRGHGKSVEARGRELSVALPAGRAFDVGLSSYIEEGRAGLFAPWRWISQRKSISDDKSGELAKSGQLPGVTPPRKLRLIHAVQRPLIPDGGIRFHSWTHEPRIEGEVALRLLGELAIDVPSTGRVDVQAQWSEMIDNPALPTWTTSDHSAELFPRNVGPKGEATAADCTPPAPQNNGFPICGTQSFSDTHHRKVRYRAHAVSRFLEFYPEELTKDRANVSRPSTEVEVHVPSTAAPAVPEVAYAVPAFAWKKEQPDKRTLQVTRSSLFRVYLKRGWFSSGDDEMAAVVLAPPSGDMNALGQFVTEWGVDPIWRSRTLDRQPRLSDFPPVPVTGATPPPCVSDLRRENIVATLRRERKPDGTTEEVTQPVDLALYPVALDEEKSLLYFDVAIATHGAYFPFVRLAIARYQPCSIDGKHVSQVVRVAFTQATPDRAITVRRASRDDYEIVVAGPSYDPHAPKENLSLGRRATIEMTLERREPGMGHSNMDWFPITEAKPLAVSGDATQTVWTGSIKTRWVQRDGYHRIVLREYEHFYADPIAPNSTKASETRRLVFAHAMRLDGI